MLTEAQQRELIYKLVLEELSGSYVNHGQFTEEKALHFLETHFAMQCPHCHRYYLDTVSACMVDKTQLQIVPNHMLMQRINVWETMRQQLSFVNMTVSSPQEAIDLLWQREEHL